MAQKKSSHYLSGREIRAIAKANRKVMSALEKKKHRRADESEFVTTMKDDSNILEIEDLHTYFFTDQGVVKAVNGVSFNIPRNTVVGVVGESGCGKSVTSMSVMQLLQGPQGQIYSGSIRFNAHDFKRDAHGNTIPTGEVDECGNPTSDIRFNPNNSTFAIEGITSPDGRVLGKMGHSERVYKNLYRNVPGEYDMGLFRSAVKYFKK